MSKRLSGAVTLASLSVLLGGCAISPLATRVASFGTAASSVAKGSSLAYEKVERIAYDAQVSSLVLDFDTKGFDPATIEPFLSGDDLAARQMLLSALQHYADLLQEVAGNQPIERLNMEVAGFGQQLKSLAGNPALQKLTGNVGEPAIKALTTAIDALGQLVIERKRRKALPPILTRMQEVVESISAVLIADLGSRPDSDGIGGRGLRGQLWLEYDRVIENQTAFLVRNKTTLSPQEKAAGVSRLPELVREQGEADSALAATQTALKDLPKAHRLLLADPKKDPSFAGAIAELRGDTDRLVAFYNSLKFK